MYSDEWNVGVWSKLVVVGSLTVLRSGGCGAHGNQKRSNFDGLRIDASLYQEKRLYR